uniref:Vps72/YL1 C-terminal domain-containing protein n=1 Tax=Chrysotila carterae TaxID=13221 RepID=A0A7S4C0X7_CHRCT|mmetsp:Transcript_38873/g.81584  ORF Transcript_38873/g.81584 Transcript_38873/m.81584 type:complete len:392 (+) Transcript_38873:221-1396(+)
MDLKGCTVTQALHDSRRLIVWYEEEQPHGLERVRYCGRVTHYNPSLGLRVWFDGFSASEQEWVNEGDEWEWEDTGEQQIDESSMDDLLPRSETPTPPDFAAVRLKMLGTSGTVCAFRTSEKSTEPLANKPSSTKSLALHSCLSLPTTENSPRKFNKKARLLSSRVEGEPSGEQPTTQQQQSAVEQQRHLRQEPVPSPHVQPPEQRPQAEARAPNQQRAEHARDELRRESRRDLKRERRRGAHSALGGGDGVADGGAALDKRQSDTGPTRQDSAAETGAPSTHTRGAEPSKSAASRGKGGALLTARLKLHIGAAGVQLLLPAAGTHHALFSQLSQRAPPPPASLSEKVGTCALSGLPARYMDPLTGIRYGSLDAFKQLRAERARATVGGGEG